jgi:aspartate/methionine/tyrosine aminotransferase
MDAEQFRLRLLREYGIGVIATGKNDVRVAFSCTEEENIPEIFELMFRCARDMRPE